MNGNCHFVYGAALGTALAMNVGAISSVLENITATPETATLLVLGGLIGGIFPDIDSPNSYMGKLSSPVSKFLGKLNKATGGDRVVIPKSVKAPLPRCRKSPQLQQSAWHGCQTPKATGKNHRGILHDPVVYIAGLILCYFYFPPLVGFFVGCLSHLFLDMFNPMGVPFLLGASHLRLGKIPSGSKSSIVFTWTNVAFVLILAVTMKIGLIDKIMV